MAEAELGILGFKEKCTAENDLLRTYIILYSLTQLIYWRSYKLLETAEYRRHEN